MTPVYTILFDECVGLPIAKAFDDFLQKAHPKAFLVRHVLEYQKQGVPDEKWIPRLAEELVIVITADRGRSGGIKLPHECIRHKITHILLVGKLHQSSSGDKISALHGVIGEIMNAFNLPRGTRLILRRNDRLMPTLETRAISDKERRQINQKY